MEKGKRAWTYCAVDAPEDENGVLKGQSRQVMEYADQMGFEVIGSSSDAGQKPLLERQGFKRFLEAALKNEVNILLVASPRCLSHSTMQRAQFQALIRNRQIQIYSPLTGRMEDLT